MFNFLTVPWIPIFCGAMIIVCVVDEIKSYIAKRSKKVKFSEKEFTNSKNSILFFRSMKPFSIWIKDIKKDVAPKKLNFELEDGLIKMFIGECFISDRVYQFGESFSCSYSKSALKAEIVDGIISVKAVVGENDSISFEERTE